MTTPPPEHPGYSYITDFEREEMQRQSHEFFRATGRNMRIPPRLWDELSASGVTMTYMTADPSLGN